MELIELINKAHEQIDADSIGSLVISCLKISRKLKDHFYTAIFLREMILNEDELTRTLMEDTEQLNDKTKAYLLKKSKEYWLISHTLDFSFGKDDKGYDLNIMRVTSSEIEDEIKQSEKSIIDLNIPTGMTPIDTAVFYNQALQIKGNIRLRIKALNQIKRNILVRCTNYIIKIEKQLAAQTKSESFLKSVQTEVNNFFESRSEDTYKKLIKASQLIDSTDPEDFALLLTLVRKSIQSAADHFFPPVTTGLYRCSDGKERDLSSEKYLNRLEEFLSTNFSKSTSTELLESELKNLTVFLRRLNDISSKGVHSKVDIGEAKQGLLGLYLFLYNVISRLQAD